MKYTIPPPRYKLNIVESGVKHYKPNPKTSNGNIVESGVKHHNRTLKLWFLHLILTWNNMPFFLMIFVGEKLT